MPTPIQPTKHRTRLAQRLGAVALDQLRAEVTHLACALEHEQRERMWAEDAAESWRDDFLRLAEETGARVGITCSGQLVAMRHPIDVHGGVPAGLP